MSMSSLSKVNLATFMRDRREQEASLKQPGPFLTISREYGCSGYFLGLLLVDLLSGEHTSRQPWKVYHREILHYLANETNIAEEILDRVRRERPTLLNDIFRSFSPANEPPGFQIRNRVDNIVRGLAYEGNAIIIGMGADGATSEIPNGLRIRLVGPVEWRTVKVAESQGVDLQEARQIILKRDREWEEMRKAFSCRFPRHPSFDIVYDCESFALSQIAQDIVQAMRLRKMI